MERDCVTQFIPGVFTFFYPLLIVFNILCGIYEGWNDIVIAGLVISSVLFVYSLVLFIYQIYFKFTPLPSIETNDKLNKNLHFLSNITCLLFIISLSISGMAFMPKFDNFGLYSKILIILWLTPMSIVFVFYGIYAAFVFPIGLLVSCFTFLRCCGRNL
jgi:hypothetical protein